MLVEYSQVQEDYARKDAEIAKLKTENERLKAMILVFLDDQEHLEILTKRNEGNQASNNLHGGDE